MSGDDELKSGIGDTFHDRINELYEEARDADHTVGRKKFAQMCGVTLPQVNGWLNRNGEPKFVTLKKVAAQRGVCSSWLIGETNIRQIPTSSITEHMPKAALDELQVFLDYLKFKYKYE